MIRILLLLLFVSCGNAEKGQNGLNGIDGVDGGNYYSYLVEANLQEIVGDGRSEVFEDDQADIYQLPSTFNLNVDNSYPDCELQDLEVIVETDNQDLTYVFQPTENRYRMKIKSGPEEKVIDSSFIKVYYKGRPEVDCGSTTHRLHSGLQFEIRVFKEIELEEI